MLREMIHDDFSLASSLIGNINRSGRQFFDEACQKGNMVKGLISDSSEKQGVVALSQGDEFLVCHISFINDLQDEEMLQEIDQFVQGAIEGKGEKDLYLNLYGGNSMLISRFRAKGFKEDVKGYQFCYRATQGVPSEQEIEGILSPLEFRRFEEKDADLYIEVTDEAFKPLDLQSGCEPCGSKRHREQVIPALKRRDENGEFGSFWLKDELVGIFILHNEYINTIAVHPKFQSQGWGSDILKYCIYHMVKNKKYEEIYLNCLEINEQGLHYYRKNNFQVVGYFSENTYRATEN